jgi:hypothetical protein
MNKEIPAIGSVNKETLNGISQDLQGYLELNERNLDNLEFFFVANAATAIKQLINFWNWNDDKIEEVGDVPDTVQPNP